MGIILSFIKFHIEKSVAGVIATDFFFLAKNRENVRIIYNDKIKGNKW